MQTAWEINKIGSPGDTSGPERECLREALNISPLLARLLSKRGVSTVEGARRFLSCDLSYLYDPFLLRDMDKAVDRINSAIQKKESILIYGDYDVDGLTATALLFLTLKKRGARPSYYIPDRVKEGYGLNLEALKKAKDNAIDLVIAVDCGITAVKEADYLKKHNIDCIILDHHQPLEGVIPDAVAVINPLRPDCDYPYKYLAGVGLVFKLTQALKADDGNLDLVTLGTISDVAPLTGENRILVKHGLKHLANTGRKGLRALIESAGIGNKKEFYTETVGFTLGPRINASGRVSSSLNSLKLLLTEDADEASALAEGLNRDNRERQAMQETILKEAVSKVEREVNFKSHKVIVVSSDKWHPGVIGIVASRIAEKFYRPAILVAFDGDIGKGSGRSIRNFHLFDALSKCKEHLVEYGGHKHAAGITISKDNIDVFRERFNSVASEALQPLDLIPRLEIDAEISLSDLTMKFVKELASLEPYGVGNPKPVFAVRGLSLKTKPQILTANTLKLWVTDGKLTYEAIGFKKAFDFKLDPAPRNFSLAFTPSVNAWQGRESVQLVIKDLQI